VAVLLAAVLLIATPLQGQDSMVGDWNGTLDAGTMRLRLVLHIEQGESGYTATMDSPDQGAHGIAASDVTVSGDSVNVAFSQLGARYAGEISGDGSALTGTFSQAGQTFSLVLERGGMEEARRPQNPEPPFPYEVEEVTFPGGVAGVELAGTLTVPSEGGPHPAAILVTGSGPQNRNEDIFQHKPFLVLADYLTRRGIVVLRYDDRGVAESTGDYASATSADFTDDAEAAFRLLRDRDDVRGDAIGVIGHSEGGLVAQLLASRLPQLGYIVMMAGPGVSGDSILVLQAAALNRAAGLPEETLAVRTRLQRRLMDAALGNTDPERARAEITAVFETEVPGMPDEQVETQARVLTSPWMLWFLNYDPQPILRSLTLPVLALNGSKDLQVLAGPNLDGIAEGFRQAGNRDFTVVELDGLNHLFQTADTGMATEYGQIEETIAPAALKTIGDWIVARFGGS